MKASISIDLEKLATAANVSIVFLCATFAVAGHLVSFYFHFLTVAFFLLVLLNFYWRHIQKTHTLLSNFGFLAQIRYMVESVGPEFRQYLSASDTEERPFTRLERAEVYRKAKGIDATESFGSLMEFDRSDIKLRHSFYPMAKKKLQPFEVTVGTSRGLKSSYVIRQPVMIGGMSYGALGEKAVRALSRGAKRAGALMNTGEGGYPKYHLMEGADLIFQIGTAKFGVCTERGGLDERKLQAIAELDAVKLIEIKFSQGAKPGKGGILPKEKITQEISDLRGIPMGKDAISPPFHEECGDPASTVQFIDRVQKCSGLPTGIKFCLGQPGEFRELLREMKRQSIFPDFITVDGGEGGTGAAPKSFMDDVGLPLFEALPLVNQILLEEGIRDRLVLFAAGKLISPGKQMKAFALGADCVYTARGFMLALGCIQAVQCNRNTCPVGITTHDKALQSGLDIEKKAQRVYNYIQALHKDHLELLSALGKSSAKELTQDQLRLPALPRALREKESSE